MFNPAGFVDWSRGRVRSARKKSRDLATITRYLANHEIRCLQIGSGRHALPGWLNSDVGSGSTDVVELDATKRFPLDDATFDFVYSEHMIEHVPYADGSTMLRECCRILKPGGTLRITTPDVQFLAGLLGADLTSTQRAYIRWSTESFLPHATGNEGVFVVNNFFRDWGHQFIYDAPTFRDALVLAGFDPVVSCDLGRSDHPELRGLENESRMPAGFLALESMTFEASKPQRRGPSHPPAISASR